MSQLTVAVLVDQSLTQSRGDTAVRQLVADYILSANNTFSEQLGITVNAISVDLNYANTETQADKILNAAIPAPRGPANVTLVLTDKAITSPLGDPWGGASTAFAPCSSAAASVVHVSPAKYVYIDGEVMKHELGHILGLPHDGEGACIAENSIGHIMERTVYGQATTFSACSIAEAKKAIASHGCYVEQAGSQLPVATPITPYVAHGGGAIGVWPVILLSLLLLKRLTTGMR